MKGLCGGRTPARSEAQGGKVATPERGRPPAEPPCSQARATTDKPPSFGTQKHGGGRERAFSALRLRKQGRERQGFPCAMMCPP